MENIQFIAVDGNKRWGVQVLAQHVGLLQGDGEPEVFASLGEPIHETLELLFGEWSDCTVISEEHVSDEGNAHLLSAFQGWTIVYLIWCVGTLLRLRSRRRASAAEKEDAKEGGRKDTASCFTPLLMSNGSDILPSYCMVAFISSWKDLPDHAV